MKTFGQVIAKVRKEAGLSQRALAGRLRRENGAPISAQYLNDIERDRRNPPSAHVLTQLADALYLPREYLFFLAKQFPPDLRDTRYGPDQVQAAFVAFRQVLKGKSPRAGSGAVSGEIQSAVARVSTSVTGGARTAAFPDSSGSSLSPLARGDDARTPRREKGAEGVTTR